MKHAVLSLLASLCLIVVLSAQTQTITLTLIFDNYPQETRWEITNSSLAIVASGGTYSGQAGLTLNVPISLGAGTYTLTVFDSANDGMCCGYGSGSYSLKNASNVVLASGAAFTSSQATQFTLTNTCTSNSLPTVSLSGSPTAITGSGTVSLSASASDIDGTISKVEFYRNNVLIGNDLSSPYTFSYSETAVGTYSYTAKATDNCSGVGTSNPVNVVVSSSNPCTSNTAPTVSISQPANNSTVTAGTNLQISASATDNGTVTQVQFYNGTTLLGTSTVSPFSYTYASIPAGTYTFTAKATDNCGAVTTSSIVNVTVSAASGSTCNPWALNCTTTGDITRTGRVGIGTGNFLSDASYLLYVKGGIRAEKMQLELSSAGGWADYVFAPNYKLMPLKQVSEYLKTNRHLPGMASGTEMEADGGIDVGKITVKQQEKIEELFLYVIELNKKMETLQNQVKKLETENNILRKKTTRQK
jgi:hypothetical protein